VPGDRSPWAEAVGGLGGYADAVLATAAPGELPVLRRVRVTPDAATRRLLLDPLDGSPAGPVPARGSLLLHGHDERIGALRQFGVVGALSAVGGHSSLEPERFVPGMTPESPLGMIRTMRRLRRNTRGYLDDRGLPRPAVDWEAFRELQAAQPAPRTTGSRITAR
jgi:hypothetical protein